MEKAAGVSERSAGTTAKCQASEAIRTPCQEEEEEEAGQGNVLLSCIGHTCSGVEVLIERLLLNVLGILGKEKLSSR